MKCEICGGGMIKIDENVLKCEKCGYVVNMKEKGINEEGENYIDSVLP